MIVRHTSIAFVFGLLFAVRATAARADTAAEARFHDASARAAFENRSYELALEEFFLAQRLAPNSRTTFNIALCLELLKRTADAYMYFDAFLSDEGSLAPDLTELRAYAKRAMAALAENVALVRVDSTPAGATVFVDRREHGSYGVTPRTLALGAGAHRVWVELEGYRSAEKELEAKLGESVDVALSPERILGALVVSSPVSGRARVLTPDGQVVAEGATPFEVRLPPGPYETRVTADRHLPWRGLVTVHADSVARQEAVPEVRPQPTGDLTITSNISGAVIALDGRPAGFTPAVLSDLETGRYRLSLASEGLVPWEGEVNVLPNERAWVTVKLDEPATVVRSPAAWVLGGVGVAALTAGGVMTAVAADRYAAFERASEPEQADLRRSGRSANLAADLLLASGAVALGTSIYLFISTAKRQGGRSTASIARDER